MKIKHIFLYTLCPKRNEQQKADFSFALFETDIMDTQTEFEMLYKSTFTDAQKYNFMVLQVRGEVFSDGEPRMLPSAGVGGLKLDRLHTHLTAGGACFYLFTEQPVTQESTAQFYTQVSIEIDRLAEEQQQSVREQRAALTRMKLAS